MIPERAAGEGERHAPPRKDQPCARAQHALAQAAQAPAGSGGMRHPPSV